MISRDCGAVADQPFSNDKQEKHYWHHRHNGSKSSHHVSI